MDILQSQVYGYLPEKPACVQFEVVRENAIPNFCAGNAQCTRLQANCSFADGKTFSFPFQLTLPVAEGKHPFFIFASFAGENPNKYLPAEELIDEAQALGAGARGLQTAVENMVQPLLFRLAERRGTQAEEWAIEGSA